MTSIYVAACQDRFVKVGLSRDANLRVENLQRILGRPLRLVHEEKASSAMSAKRIEQKALQDLREFCIGGEWFECPIVSAVNAVKGAVEFVEVQKGELDYRLAFIPRSPKIAIEAIREKIPKPEKVPSVRRFSPESAREIRYVERKRKGGAKNVTVWIDAEDLWALDIITERAGGSVSAAIRQAIKEAAK